MIGSTKNIIIIPSPLATRSTKLAIFKTILVFVSHISFGDGWPDTAAMAKQKVKIAMKILFIILW